MNQQDQNQKITLGNEKNGGAGQSSGSVVRTMAEDLKEMAGQPRQAAPKPSAPAAVPVRPFPSGAPVPPPAPGAEKRTEAPAPSAEKPDAGKKNRMIGIIAVAGAVAVLAAVVAAWSIFWSGPSAQGTWYDNIPGEALALASAKKGQPFGMKYAEAFAAHFGIPAEKLGQGWERATFVVLPGGTASEPLGALYLTGNAPSPDLSGADTLVTIQKGKDTAVIMEKNVQGRWEGFTGPTLGENGDFKALMAMGEAAGGSVDIYLAKESGKFLTSPLLYKRLTESPALLVRIGEAAAGTAESAIFTQAAPAGLSAIDPEMARFLPNGVLSAFGGGDIAAGMDAFKRTVAGEARLTELLRAAEEREAAFAAVKAMLSGKFVYGTLPAEDSAGRDFFMMIEHNGDKEGLKAAMGEIEKALIRSGQYISGGAFISEGEFAETEYAGLNIRYANFGSPKQAFDYAVGDKILLVASSRESMRAAADAISGSGPSDEDAAKLISERSAAIFLDLDKEITAELPAPWQVVMIPLKGFSASQDLKTGSVTVFE